LQKVHLI